MSNHSPVVRLRHTQIDEHFAAKRLQCQYILTFHVFYGKVAAIKTDKAQLRMKPRLETRNITSGLTGRTTIQLEPEAWALIDSVAAVRGQDWRAWVEHVMGLPAPDGVSRAAWLRTCGMRQFREIAMRDGLELEAQNRADAIAAGDPFANPELDSILGFLDDERLSEHLTECPVEGSTDLGGFVLHVGFDEFKRRCFWIENRMKDSQSLVISIPMLE